MDSEIEVARARRRLGDERLLTFLRALREREDILACKLINEDLDQRKSLDEIFYTGKEFGFFLEVRGGRDGIFKITFGYAAPPTAGDWGTWKVQFNGDGQIIYMELEDQWIA